MWGAIIGGLITAVAGNASADKVSNAEKAASSAALAQQQQTLDYQRNLIAPYYKLGGAAANKLASIYGLPQQDFSGGAANFGNPTSGAAGGSASPIASTRGTAEGKNALPSVLQPSIGAQVVNYLSNEGPGANALAKQGIRDPVWTANRLFGLQKKATNATDVWGTPQTNAADAGKYDYEGYGNATDLKNAYANLNAKDKSFIKASLDVNNDGDLSLGEFVQWWAQNTDDGKAAVARGDLKTPAQAADAANQANGTAAYAPASDPLADFWASPYGKLQTDQFLSVDNPAIKAQFATNGKVLSGAQQTALADRGRATAGGAFGNYVNGLSSVAGYGTSSTNTLNSDANVNNTNSTNLLLGLGNINAQNAQAKSNNWMNFLNGLGGAVYRGTGSGANTAGTMAGGYY